MFKFSNKKLTNNEENEIINVNFKSYWLYIKNSN